MSSISFANELSQIKKGDFDINVPKTLLNEIIKYFQKRCVKVAREGCKELEYPAEVFNPNPDDLSDTCSPFGGQLNYPREDIANAHAVEIKLYLETKLKSLGFSRSSASISIERKSTVTERTLFGRIKAEYNIHYKLNIILYASWN